MNSVIDLNPATTTRKDSRKSPSRITLDEAYEHCRRLATSHYENFPVGSFLAPERLRRHIHAIYAYARIADDIADEGNDPAEVRLRKLDRWEEEFNRCLNHPPDSPVFIALSETIRQCSLPADPFLDLLKAFRLDVTTTSFDRYEDLLDYCSKSANPIGQLVLEVYGCTTAETRTLSDNLCTGLQLANFWQDVAVDMRKGRTYLPLEDCERFGYTRDDLRREILNPPFTELMKFQVGRTRDLFDESSALPGLVPFRLGLELRATWNGGMTILRKIEEAGYNVLTKRPSITTFDKLGILATSLFKNLQ